MKRIMTNLHVMNVHQNNKSSHVLTANCAHTNVKRVADEMLY